jgi:hypothetical protein
VGYGNEQVMFLPALDLAVAVNASAYEESNVQVNQIIVLIVFYVIPAVLAVADR